MATPSQLTQIVEAAETVQRISRQLVILGHTGNQTCVFTVLAI